ncbi:MAG: phosphoserine phosphatase SerB [Sphingomonadaceae bacterium]|nr:phosphoserine phosphatase SerB [Sphingomonadaceae bacterium]
MFIATLIAASLPKGEVAAARDRLDAAGCLPVAEEWVEDGVACDLQFGRDMAAARAALEGEGYDVVVQPVEHRRKKLIVADMDSTMITVECIDELADYVGLKAEVAAVTERAMRGEIDFAGALRDRVVLLAGMKESTVAKCLRERVKVTSGAKGLIRAFRANGGTTILVSGGFNHFADPVAAEIGFDRALANRLVVKDGRLTGVTEQPIVDAEAKKATLLTALAERGLPPSASIAIGDGANDIPMIEAAGLGVAYHAKPKTEAAADARVRFGDLSVVRYSLGI